MSNAQIQIQFPMPGEWDKFILMVVYREAEGYTHTDQYTQDDIPADQAPALAAAVTAIASMGEDWQASQAWARLAEFFTPEEDDPLKVVEAVELTVEAVNAQGGRKTFTIADYPEFMLTDLAAVEFFKHFIKEK